MTAAVRTWVDWVSREVRRTQGPPISMRSQAKAGRAPGLVTFGNSFADAVPRGCGRGRELTARWSQHDCRRKRDQPIELPEGDVRHQQVERRVDPEPSPQQVAHGDLVDRGNLERSASACAGMRSGFEVKQYRAQVGRLQRRDRSLAGLAEERKGDSAPGAAVEVSLALLEEPGVIVVPWISKHGLLDCGDLVHVVGGR